MRTEPTKIEAAMLKAVAAYLESKGWNVAVVGAQRIQGVYPYAACNFEFVIRFTGKAKANDEH